MKKKNSYKDAEQYWEVRDPLSKDMIGYKHKQSDSLFVPVDGMIDDFIYKYNALKNYDMGLAVEFIDQLTGLVHTFELVYSFKNDDFVYVDLKKGYHVYRILTEPLSNLDILEIINAHKNRGKK